MARLTNQKTGVVVNVSDATAARLGSDWKGEDAKPEPVKRGRPKKTESSEDK